MPKSVLIKLKNRQTLEAVEQTLLPPAPISVILHCKFFSAFAPQSSTNSFGINQKT